MCMLTYLPPQTQPDKEALENGAKHNNDGHGYAIVIPGKFPRLLVRHSLNRQLIVDNFMKDRERYPEGPALFHSRWGTSGIEGKFNCHPFVVGGDELTVVAHNGVLSKDIAETSIQDDRCDTRIAADDVFATRYGDLNTEAARDRLGAAIGKQNKLVILTINSHYEQSAYIINADSGNWDTTGIWYSNYDYCGYKSNSVANYGTWSWDKDDDGMYSEPFRAGERCPMCDALGGIDVPSQTCAYCESCLDCFENLMDCTCYVHPKPSVTDDYDPNRYDYWSEAKGEYVSYEEWRLEFDAKITKMTSE